MRPRFRFSLLFFALLLTLPVVAQQRGVVVVDISSKELKRTAHQLRIPVEQLRNARQALQEATDLAGKIDPYPSQQIVMLAQSWSRLNHSKAKTAISSFIHDLRSQAAEAKTLQAYVGATSAAMGLLQSSTEMDTDEILQVIQSWPQPDPSIGPPATNFRDDLLAQYKRQMLSRMASSDPEKALSLLQDPDASGSLNYRISAQVAQGLANLGKSEDALKLIDRAMNDFNQRSNDSRAVQEYENFVSMTSSVDPARAGKAMNQLLTAVMNQPPSGDCSGTLKSGDVSVDLTCSESRVLNIIRRSGPMHPEFTMKALDSVPGLKSKLDSVGGIDALYSGRPGAAGVSVTTRTSTGQAGVSTAPPVPLDPGKLFQELKGKAEKNPGLVRATLRDIAKDPDKIDLLINLAMMSAYQEPDLGSLALEIAQELFPRVEPLQKRAMTLQNLVRAYRQVDGEVDSALLRDGFVLADKLRQEPSEKSAGMNMPPQLFMAGADQLEAFLVSELSRDSFETALRYVRAKENNAAKLMSLIQIIQALSQSN